MRIAAFIFLIIALAFLGSEIYSYKIQETQLTATLSQVNAELQSAQADRDKFKEELNYYQNPANLEKELRARFNYRSPGEKMIIIVPRPATSSATSSHG